MPWINGQILTEEGFVEGSLEFDDESIIDISRQKSKDPVGEGVVLPLFVNPHTHIGDSFIKDDLNGTIEEIVAPPDGLKHRRLEEASNEDVIEGMRGTLERMRDSGISHFVDFREGGIKGVSLLLNASLDSPLNPIIYGRPERLTYDKGEVESLLKVVDGIGISSVGDWETSILEEIRRDVKESGKGFATHASESVREDIDVILDLDPDFLIHMTEADESDLERCADAGVPVVICPRSNAHFRKAPPLGKMLSKGVELMLGTCPRSNAHFRKTPPLDKMLSKSVELMLGTDNAMLNSPSLFDEMRFLRQMSKQDDSLTSGHILRMAIDSRKVLKGRPALLLGIGQPSEFLVLKWHGGKPENFIVDRASEKDISIIVRETRMWTRKDEHLKEESDWLREDRRR
jgi:cytosine/adenosine deaminase-related metal-dependent hydrolase